MKTKQKIKEVEREIEEAKKGEIVAGTECNNCGVELLVKKHKICESCNKIKLQTLKECEKEMEEIIKKLKEKRLQRTLKKFDGNWEKFDYVPYEEIDKIFGGKLSGEQEK